jgi:iron complex outermembrane receptor protein
MLKTSILMMQACGVLVFSTAIFAEGSANSASSNDTIELQALQVEGRALTLYKEDESTIGTRTNTPIDEIPQTVQVITQDLIEDQAATKATDLYRSISGVSHFNYGAVTFRGFEQDGEVLYDGIKGDPFGLISIFQLFNVEEIQVLKGPSGALYGAGEAGGVINYVSKKPTYEQKNTIEVTAGNKDFLSGSIESSGPANQDGSQRYRVGIYSSGEDSYRNHFEEENEIIDLGYAWDINDDSTLTLQYSHYYQMGERLRGVPIDSDGNFLTDSSWNSNELSDYLKFESDVFQANLEHSINSWLESNFTLRYFETEETIKYHQVTDISGDTATLRYQDQYREYKGIDLASYFVADLGKHTLLTGADYHYESEYRVLYRLNNAQTLSLSDPDYESVSYDIDDLTLNNYDTTDTNQVGIYIQDQYKATNKLDLVMSARLDRIEEEVTDHSDGDSKTSYDDTGYSARIGATYALSHHFKPYTSFSTSLTPQSASDQQTSEDGSLFDPEENQQFEVGVRTYLLNNRVNINMALYHIVKNNVLTEDPDDDDYNIAIGEVRSQGFELDILADITARWVANVNYAYNDLEVKDSDASLRTLSNSPYHQLGLWTRYEFPSIDSSIAFGMDYVSEQSDRDDNTIQPFTIYDMSWQTRWQDWKFQANIKNLFDKEYVVSGFNSYYANVGERRRIYLSATYDF